MELNRAFTVVNKAERHVAKAKRLAKLSEDLWEMGEIYEEASKETQARSDEAMRNAEIETDALLDFIRHAEYDDAKRVFRAVYGLY